MSDVQTFAYAAVGRYQLFYASVMSAKEPESFRRLYVGDDLETALRMAEAGLKKGERLVSISEAGRIDNVCFEVTDVLERDREAR